MGDRIRSTSYFAVHQRLTRARGKASAYPCAQCGEPARQWAYDNADPSELLADGIGPYSPDLGHYQPLCIPCHRGMDGGRRTATRETCQRGLHAFPENRKLIGAKQKPCCRLCLNEYKRTRERAKKALKESQKTLYRHWHRAIIRVGILPPDDQGRRPDDEFVGVVDDPALAARICELLNANLKRK